MPKSFLFQSWFYFSWQKKWARSLDSRIRVIFSSIFYPSRYYIYYNQTALVYLVILWLEGRVWLLNIVLYLLMVGLQDVCVVVREMPEQAQGAVLQAQGGGGRRGRGVAPVQQLAHAAQTTQRGLYTLHTIIQNLSFNSFICTNVGSQRLLWSFFKSFPDIVFVCLIVVKISDDKLKNHFINW